MLKIHKPKTVLYQQSYQQSQKQPKISDINRSSSDLPISSLQIGPVHLFVDLLVKVQQIMLDTSSSENIAVLSTVHQHLEVKSLPTI